MAGIVNTWLRMNQRLAAFLMRKGGIPFARASQDKLGRLEATAVANRVELVPHAFPQFRAAWALPQGYAPDGGAILYLHGGGYTAGDLEYATGFGSVLAAATGCRVFAAAYRLAPEHPFPAALEDALTAYRHLLDGGLTPGEIALCGESAGGGLCFALTHKLNQLGLPMPRAIVAISPWTDLTLSGASCRANRRSDPSLRYDLLASYARMYARDDLKNPLVSPLFGDVSGFPPTLLFAGEAELLLDDAVSMAHALERAGVPCELHTARGMWHVYVLYGVREAREALKRIVQFLKDYLAVRDVPAAAEDDEDE